MSENYVVYMHENIENHKKYIGITCMKPSHRWGRDGSRYEQCPYFYKAIQKYGWDHFTHTILYDHLTAAEANDLEIATIVKYDTTSPEHGYNLSPGGFKGTGEANKRKWQDPSFHDKVSQIFREAWKDEDKRAKRSALAKERWSNPEFHDKIVASIEKSCGTAVRCVETGEVFSTVRDAAMFAGANHSNICRALRTGYRCGGYHWEYADNVSEKPNDYPERE